MSCFIVVMHGPDQISAAKSMLPCSFLLFVCVCDSLRIFFHDACEDVEICDHIKVPLLDNFFLPFYSFTVCIILPAFLFFC